MEVGLSRKESRSKRAGAVSELGGGQARRQHEWTGAGGILMGGALKVQLATL